MVSLWILLPLIALQLSGEGVTPSVSRLSLNREDVIQIYPRTNGVWHCRLNAMGVRDSQGSTYDEQINVGIFSRGGGELSCCFTDWHELKLPVITLVHGPLCAYRTLTLPLGWHLHTS